MTKRKGKNYPHAEVRSLIRHLGKLLDFYGKFVVEENADDLSILSSASEELTSLKNGVRGQEAKYAEALAAFSELAVVVWDEKRSTYVATLECRPGCEGLGWSKHRALEDLVTAVQISAQARNTAPRRLRTGEEMRVIALKAVNDALGMDVSAHGADYEKGWVDGCDLCLGQIGAITPTKDVEGEPDKHEDPSP